MSTQRRVRIALIGAGGWGFQHARILASHPAVNFCAIVEQSEERARMCEEQFGVRSYLDIDQMLQKEQPDLVDLCLPNQEHFAATLQVIEAGCPLLVEKPLIFDLHEADILLNEAAKRSLFFAIDFNHRYARPAQMAYQAIQSGRVGEISFATWRFGGEAGTSTHPYANLIETQCHGFDLLEFLAGPIESVMAQMTEKTGGNGCYHTFALALRFASGAVGSLMGSDSSSYAYPTTHLMEINGSRGRLLIEDTVRRYSFHALGNETGEVWQAGYFNDRDREFPHTFGAHLDVLLEAFKEGKEPPVHAQAGRRVLMLAYACIRSFETGKRIPVDLQVPYV